MNDQEPAWFTALQPTFKIGNRVRIRVSPECFGHANCSDSEGTNYVDGKVGTITEVPSWSRVAREDHPDHPHYVFFGDREFPRGGMFATFELEPLTSQPARGQGE